MLAGLLFVLRPMALRIGMPAKAALAGAAAGGGAVLEGGKVVGQIEEEEEMVRMANIDGAMRMSSIRKVADLIESRSDESLALLRSWLAPEAN